MKHRPLIVIDKAPVLSLKLLQDLPQTLHNSSALATHQIEKGPQAGPFFFYIKSGN